MYQVVYYHRETTGSNVVERKYQSDEFRLRRNALHYVLNTVQSDYREDGYGTEPRVGGIYCYKSEKTDKGDRKVIEVLIKVEKA